MKTIEQVSKEIGDFMDKNNHDSDLFFAGLALFCKRIGVETGELDDPQPDPIAGRKFWTIMSEKITEALELY